MLTTKDKSHKVDAVEDVLWLLSQWPCFWQSRARTRGDKFDSCQDYFSIRIPPIQTAQSQHPTLPHPSKSTQYSPCPERLAGRIFFVDLEINFGRSLRKVIQKPCLFGLAPFGFIFAEGLLCSVFSRFPTSLAVS
jgi:hypothetical protein